MPQWSAEIAVDEPLARRLLREQFPELEIDSLRLLAAGWDNSVWVVDERWAFRFPRREIAVPLVERELSVLPHLAPLLPLPIPVPRFVGEPTDSYPWPFLGNELIPGCELGSATLDADQELALAVELARFLRALHDEEALAAIAEREGLPEDPNGRADMSTLVPKARERLAQLEEQGLWRAPATIECLLGAATSLAPSRTLVLVHGDLHFRHVLVDRGRPSGVIDWGDVSLADASVDLQLVWSFFSPPGRDAFLAEYGEVPAERELRARVFGLVGSAILALYGHDESLPEVELAALASLDRLAAG